MTLLEKLKELAQQATPGPCKVVALEFNEESGDIRYVVEFQGVKSGSVQEARRIEEAINAIPALIEVAEAARDMRKAKVTLDTIPLIAVDYKKMWDEYIHTSSVLDAALVRLEAPHED